MEFTPFEIGKSFVANGVKYTPAESFTVGRMAMLEQLEDEMLTLGDRKTSEEVMLQAMKYINAYEPGSAYTLMYNTLESHQRNARLAHYAIRICAIYINKDGEDLAVLTDEMIASKVKDWGGEDVRPFLAFAISVLNELWQRFKAPILKYLEEAKEVRQAVTETVSIPTFQEISGQEKH